MTHFKNRSCRGVSRPSTDDRPIVNRRSVDFKTFAKSQRQLADWEKKELVSYNLLPPADPKQQLKSHTELVDCQSTVGQSHHWQSADCRWDQCNRGLI